MGVGAEVHRGGIVRKVEEKWVKCEVGWAEEEQAGRWTEGSIACIVEITKKEIIN